MTKQELPIIGSKEFITIVDESIEDVPAKVDTGADSSAVWASNIYEKDGSLYYTLFDRGSRYFTGTEYSTQQYKFTQVKNSFGHTEMRYKVKLVLKIRDKKIKVECNLADRSRNRYPILIGRRTLAGKFLVDVLKADDKVPSSRVLILNSKAHDMLNDFAKDLSDATEGLECEYTTYDNLIIKLDGEFGIDVFRSDTNESLSNYDLVYFKTHYARQEFAAAVADYLQFMGIKFIDEEIASHCSNTKLSQYATLARFNLSIPKTIMINNAILADQYDRFVQELGDKFILKDPAADKGLVNYLVKSRQQFDEIVAETNPDQKYFVAQQFIPNEGDYRLIVLDKSVELIILRQGDDTTTHLNNTSTGGKGSLVKIDDMPASARALAVRSAVILNRQVAGVDLMRDSETGEWYILEVNNAPQLVSGAFMEEKISVFSKFLHKYAQK